MGLRSISALDAWPTETRVLRKRKMSGIKLNIVPDRISRILTRKLETNIVIIFLIFS